MNLTGNCLCGSVRYAIDGAIDAAGHCHCSICRKAHGAAFATWAFIDPDRFRWTAGEEHVASHGSSPGHRRGFCRHCGSPLVAMHDGRVTEVVIASIDGDPGVRPSQHVFVASKACWHDITDTLPRAAEWPPGMQPST